MNIPAITNAGNVYNKKRLQHTRSMTHELFIFRSSPVIKFNLLKYIYFVFIVFLLSWCLVYWWGSLGNIKLLLPSWLPSNTWTALQSETYFLIEKYFSIYLITSIITVIIIISIFFIIYIINMKIDLFISLLFINLNFCRSTACVRHVTTVDIVPSLW